MQRVVHGPLQRRGRLLADVLLHAVHMPLAEAIQEVLSGATSDTAESVPFRAGVLLTLT